MSNRLQSLMNVKGLNNDDRQWILTWLERWRIEFGGDDEPRAVNELGCIIAAAKLKPRAATAQEGRET